LTGFGQSILACYALPTIASIVRAYVHAKHQTFGHITSYVQYSLYTCELVQVL
jgi:hypothetical protein